MVDQIKGKPVMCMSPRGNNAVTYSKFDMGMKYSVYFKVRIKMDDGSKRDYWEYYTSFENFYEAVRYVAKMHDVIVER